jgi:hypothetical protein
MIPLAEVEIDHSRVDPLFFFSCHTGFQITVNMRLMIKDKNLDLRSRNPISIF